MGGGRHKKSDKRLGRAPFSPCNPERAREEISRQSCMLFSGMPVPYEADKEAFLAGKNLDERKRLAQAFAPNSASQAADSISYRKQPSVPSNGTSQLIQELSSQMHLTGSLRRAVLGIHNSFEEQTRKLQEHQATLRPTAQRQSKKSVSRTTGKGGRPVGVRKVGGVNAGSEGSAAQPEAGEVPEAATALETSENSAEPAATPVSGQEEDGGEGA